MHNCRIALIFTLVTFGLLPATLPRAQALDPRDFAVLVSAEVQSAPPLILLSWPQGTVATGYTISRKLLADQAWTPVLSLPGNATSFADSSVVLGAAYEYEIAQSNSDGINAYGYIYAGIELPVVGDRGRVVLLVDNTFTSDLAGELNQLSSDLVGDGWTVLRHDLPRDGAPGDVKSVIRSEYNADPTHTRAVFILGHLPVPYSGDLNPDEHANHLGAWPADAFYGDMDGSWTDTSVNDTSAEDPRNHNVPGDGKFDQSDIPGPVVLQVGRVDFFDLPAFAPRSELDLMRQYLTKNHNYRQKVFSADRRGLIRDNFGEIEGDAPATDAWRCFVSFFGSGNISVIGAGDFFPTLSSQSYLWAYGGGGGEYYQADGVGSSSDFAQQSPQAVFYMLDGSYFGDWDSSDNLLRAALATSGSGLAAACTGLPHWFLHHMALGETIGLSTVVAQNNRGLYKNQVNLSPGKVHIALMGDPTLRMHVVAPPANLVASAAGNDSVALQWSGSADSVQGYYVYRSDFPSGPFARITRRFLTDNSYLDTGVSPGSKTYMVRAIKLESTASGTYYNASQGVYSSFNDGGGQALPVVTIDAPNPDAAQAGPVTGAFSISRSGALSYALQVNFSVSGSALNGVDYESIDSSVVIPENSNTAWITIRPSRVVPGGGSQTVTLNLLSSGTYLIGSASSATVVIQDPPAPVNQPPSISSIARPVGGACTITLSGSTGQPYLLQATKDFSNWTTVTSGVFDASSTVRFVDAPPQAVPCRFYRLESKN